MTTDNDGQETCQRCGARGEDRRTLWMACFYAMHESGLPYSQVAIHGRIRERDGDEQSRFGSFPKWSEPTGDETTRQFYTLRVCKGCRAEWMGAISQWFRTPRNERVTECGNYEMTPEDVEQWRARRGNP